MNLTVTTHQAEEDIRNEQLKIYVNGEIIPKLEAKISVFDSGFMLGDGVWEGLRLYAGKWAFFDEHMDRLFEAISKRSPNENDSANDGPSTGPLSCQPAHHD